MKQKICTVHTEKQKTTTLQTVVAMLCGGTNDYTFDCCNDWGRDTGEVNGLNAINRNVMPCRMSSLKYFENLAKTL